MAKKDLDWANIGFGYHQTDKRYVDYFHDGAWEGGKLTDDPNVVLNECAETLQYAQQVFEGMKAYTWKDGSVVVFRPDQNAERIYNSAKRIEMQPYPKDKFVEAIDQVVKGNVDWVPPYGSGATLYLRPYEIGTTPIVGVAPATDYMFRIFATPVGPYYKGGATPVAVQVAQYDRAAPRGTGHVKAALNYAMSLKATVTAHQAGFAENMYLDPATQTYIEETGGSNIIFIDQNNHLVVPKSNSILPSITRRSIVYLAEHYLNLTVEERQVRFDEVPSFKECALVGTAAVLSPVGRIVNGDQVIDMPSGMDKPGKFMEELYNTLTGIQNGEVEAPEGWIHHVI